MEQADEKKRDWRIYGTAGDYTIWSDGDLYLMNFGAVPDSSGGYVDLKAMLALKNLRAVSHSFRDFALVRAAASADEPHPKTWTAHFLFEGAWRPVQRKTSSGHIGDVRFQSAEEARAAALIKLDEARLGPSKATARHEIDAEGLAVLQLIAAFPVEEVRHGASGAAGRQPDFKLYAMNGWALTVGDVYAARRAVASAVPSEEPAPYEERSPAP